MRVQRVAVVDYGAGNLYSLRAALASLEIDTVISANADDLASEAAVLLPGVGSLRAAMGNLDALGLTDFLKRSPDRGQPILGICLGMQLLFEWSEEDGGGPGLGLLAGEVRRFSTKNFDNIKIPHVGFNSVEATTELSLFDGLPGGSNFYFSHSFRLVNTDHCVGYRSGQTHYGEDFVSVVESTDSPIYGLQFHPELSHGNGLRVLANFARLSRC